MVKVFTDENFETETNKGVVLVDFWATWCDQKRLSSCGPISWCPYERPIETSFRKAFSLINGGYVDGR